MGGAGLTESGRHRRPDQAPAGQGSPAQWRALVRVVACTALGAFLVLAGAATIPRLWGWTPVVVTSGSMMPLIHPGDVVLERRHPGPVHRDDVVTYRQAGTGLLITHRVVSRDAHGDYIIKGDANRQQDAQPVSPARVVGQVRLLVPVLGWPALEFRRHPVPTAAVGGVAGCLFGLALRRRKGRHRTPAASADEHGRRRPVRIGLRLVGPGPTLIACGCLLAAGLVSHSAAKFSGTRTNSSDTLSTRGDFAFSDQVIADGPVSYWPLDETTGTVAHDIVGANPITYGAGTTKGVAGAIKNDADDAIHVASGQDGTATNPSTLNLPGSLSVMAWIRTTGAQTASNARVIAKYDGTNINYLMAWSGTTTTLRFLVDVVGGSPSRPSAQTTFAADSAWHMVVGTWDGSSDKIYIDGALKNTVAVTGGTATATNTYATSIGLSGASLIGDVDDVAIWNRAITAAEITTLYTDATT